MVNDKEAIQNKPRSEIPAIVIAAKANKNFLFVKNVANTPRYKLNKIAS